MKEEKRSKVLYIVIGVIAIIFLTVFLLKDIIFVKPIVNNNTGWVCTKEDAKSITLLTNVLLEGEGFVVNDDITFHENSGYEMIIYSSYYDDYVGLSEAVREAIAVEKESQETTGMANCCYVYEDGEYRFIIARG